MYIVSLTYTVPLPEIETHLAAHRAFLDEHYASGALIASGPKDPREGGVILAMTPDRESLDAILAQDPFHLAGVAEYEVTRFVPVKFADFIPDDARVKMAD